MKVRELVEQLQQLDDWDRDVLVENTYVQESPYDIDKVQYVENLNAIVLFVE